MFHFMMVCPEYKHLRYELFPYEAFSNLSLNSFYKLMKTKDEIIRNVSKFMYNAYIMRQAKLNDK